MLSTMTTSESFPLINQSRCTPSPGYNSVIQPTYVATILRQNLTNDGNVLKYQLIQEPEIAGGKIAPTISYYLTNSDKEEIDFTDVLDNEGSGKEDDSSSIAISKSELENDLSDLLEQLDLDDSIYEQSKPLKIDPNVLKLDFSKISVTGNLEALEKLYSIDFSENKRASHHLSGGSLLTDASQEDFESSGNKASKNRLCKLSGGGLIMTENLFNLKGLNISSGGISGFLNQISPSTPVKFDLTSQLEVTTKNDSESTNPFKNLLRDYKQEDENCFSPTNPFSEFCGSSSLCRISSVDCGPPPRYENISLPQKSFSQCSTRPTSPVLKTPEESSVSNPFLINDTSPEANAPPVPQFFLQETNFQESVPALQSPSSFIFAVPVFSIVPQSVSTDSSTQTGGDFPADTSKVAGPVYQNLTNPVQKFMKRNDHSEHDLQCLKTTMKDLRTAGWYYENVSWQESAILLKSTEPGTFLIRDSSDPNFLFSLSVQTSRGPTSVRLHYVNGQFRLDAEEKLIPYMPSFSSVIELIDYYVENTVKNKKQKAGKKSGKQNIQKSKDQVWIDSQRNVYSNILLVKPLYKKDHFSSLQHLARLTINTYVKRRLKVKSKFSFKVTPVYESSPFQDSSFQNNNFDSFCPILSTDALPIPSKLIEYLQDYPYCH